jgi:4-hydroxy-3-polyprenylbenzoate decarboxylase
MTERRCRLVVGITGASGTVYGARALELARTAGVETHLVVTRPADLTRSYESEFTAEHLRSLASFNHSVNNFGAAISSGSFPVDGMLVAPCSVRTLSAIAYAANDNLLTRAADVTLKERRRLVLLVRETPLNLAHLRAMTAVTEMGGIVMPPVPAFYLQPASIDALVTHTVTRALDLLGIEVPGAHRWNGETPREQGHNTGSNRNPQPAKELTDDAPAQSA